MHAKRLSADLIIVAGKDDRVAVELEELAIRRHCKPLLMSVDGCARIFSISTNGPEVSVEPCVPLFLRPQLPVQVAQDFDAGFLRSECFATLWAAAALSSAPVINRPGFFGLGGRAAVSAAITELRGGLPIQRVEVFSDSLPEPPGDVDVPWFTQSLQTLRTAAWPTEPEGGGPYRARSVAANPAYEVVVVLYEEAWRCTLAPLDGLQLERRSVELIEHLHLSFGTVIWNVREDLSEASVARVDPFPSMDQVQFVWPALGPALLRALLT
jgi:hypothetical protein